MTQYVKDIYIGILDKITTMIETITLGEHVI